METWNADGNFVQPASYEATTAQCNDWGADYKIELFGSDHAA